MPSSDMPSCLVILRTLENNPESCARNAMYMFNNAQNQLLSFMADELLAHIVHNIKTSHYFGIWANEVADVIRWEQLGLSVRYIKDG